MKLKKLFEALKRCKPDRKDYYIEPKIKCEVDDRYFRFFILPTILFVPWISRYHGSSCCEIMWLNLRVCIGIWRRKDDEVKWF